jgi:hypothetical protein
VSDAAQPERLDVAELAATLLAEVRSGIAARTEVAGSHLDVVEARVRVGERATGAPPVAAGTAAPAPAADEGDGSGLVASPVLAEVGWQVELVLRADPLRVAGSEASGLTGQTGSLPPPATAVGLWRDRPTADLKGVDRVRAAQLAQHGVHRIGDLIDLDEDGIARVVMATRASRLLEVWVRAALLATPVPALPSSPADRRSLAWLAGRSPTTLRGDLGASRVSRSGATALFDLLAAWSTALDRAALGTVTLGEVRAASRR